MLLSKKTKHHYVRDLLPRVVTNYHHVVLTVSVQYPPSMVRIAQEAFHVEQPLEFSQQIVVAIQSREINASPHQATLFVNL